MSLKDLLTIPPLTEECPICFELGADVYTACCNNPIHGNCFSECSKAQSERGNSQAPCPICRATILDRFNKSFGEKINFSVPLQLR